MNDTLLSVLLLVGIPLLFTLGMGCECPRCERDLGMLPRRCPREGEVPR